MRRLRLAASLFLAIVAAEARATAEEIERIAVSYEAHPLCPNEDAFVGEIAARTSKFRRVRENEAGRTIRVKLSEEPGHAMIRGELVLAERDNESTRVVHDENCTVVVSGLALIAALAIDPEAETGPVDPLAHAPPPAPPAPPPAVPPPPPPPRVTKAPERKPPKLQIGVTGGAAARIGLVPRSGAVTVAAFVGWERLQARMELSAGVPRTESAGVAAAELQWLGGHLEGCHLWGRGLFRAGPCALFELGVVRAAGVDVRDAQSETRIGASAGAGPRAALTAGHFYAEIGVFLLVPFRRDRFYVDAPNGGGVTVFQTSAVGGQFGAGVGLLF